MDDKVLDDEQNDALDIIEEDLEEIEDEAAAADDMTKRETAEISREKLKEFRELVEGI